VIKSHGCERQGKGRASGQVSVMEMNTSESLMRCRNRIDDVKTAEKPWSAGRDGQVAGDWPVGIRHRSGMNMTQALIRNVRTCRGDAKGEAQVGSPHKRQSTNAPHRGGRLRSSGEVR
jgi:hypothetical protein